MNNIITLKRLIDLISKQAGCDYSTAAAFVKAFTAQVRDALVAGETVRIKGIGDFSASDDHKITLEVDPSLAAIINEPFAMFSPEELDADIEIPSSSDALPQPKSDTETQEAPESEEPANVNVADSNVTMVQTEAAEQEPEAESTPASPEVVPAQRPRIPKAQYKPWEDEESDNTSDEEGDHRHHHSHHHHHHHHHESEESKFPYFWTLIGVAIGFIIGLCIGFFVHDPIEEMLEPSLSESSELLLEIDDPDPLASDSLISNPDTLATDTAATQATDPIAEEKPAPKPEEKIEVKAETPAPAANSGEVYETVTSGVTLAKLAKRHYGSDIYWVFIYLENKDQIKNPDNLLLGAKLRIPPLSKYAPQATEAERRAAAQKKMAEIRRK